MRIGAGQLGTVLRQSWSQPTSLVLIIPQPPLLHTHIIFPHGPILRRSGGVLLGVRDCSQTPAIR